MGAPSAMGAGETKTSGGGARRAINALRESRCDLHGGDPTLRAPLLYPWRNAQEREGRREEGDDTVAVGFRLCG